MSLAIIGLLAMLTLPLTSTDLTINRLQSAAENLRSSMLTAQQSAYSGKENSSYEVVFNLTNYQVLTYNSAGVVNDTQTIELPATITFSNVSLVDGTNKVKFNTAKLTPSTTGTVTLANSDGVAYKFTIYAVGSIFIERVEP